MQNFGSVEINVEEAACLAASRHVVLAVKGFRKMETEFVNAGGERNVIVEYALPTILVNARFPRAENRVIYRLEGAPSVEIAIRSPNASLPVGVVAASMSGKNEDFVGSG